MWLPATKTEVGSRGITAAGGEPDLLRLLLFYSGISCAADTRKLFGRRSISMVLRLEPQTLYILLRLLNLVASDSDFPPSGT